jgi:hypothetical protein
MRLLVTSLIIINTLVFLGFTIIDQSSLLPAQPPTTASRPSHAEEALPSLTLISELPVGDEFLSSPESDELPDSIPLEETPDGRSIEPQENAQKPAVVAPE